ncbi:MAG: DUF882 domain-containing protein [Allorhizobium sp.]
MRAPSGINWRGRMAVAGRSALKSALAILLLLVVALPLTAMSSSRASAENRTLNIVFVHTGEKASITFKRNGRYDANGLKQLNNILRDWRRNQPTKMDPRLFDLVWEVYKRAGARGYINVVSGFRSPETNSMLRSRSKGVAKNSQHMMGKAMDFYIPGVQLKLLRELGVKLQAGGVGYYPTSGSPFVHMDVASVRAWPRLSRQELSRIFPDGKTLHLPSDGKPMPGYQLAMAEYKKRLSSNTIVASESRRAKPKNFLAALFGGGTGDEDEEEDVVPAERPAVQTRPVVAEPTLVAAVAPPPPVQSLTNPDQLPGVEMVSAPPVPQARPSFKPGDGSLAVALYSPTRSAAEDALTEVAAGTPAPADGGFADLQALHIPVPTLLGPRGMKGDAQSEVLTASLASSSMPDGQDDLPLVPVPANRPAVAEALLASVEAQDENDVDEVEQAILSPQAAEALKAAEALDEKRATTEVVEPVVPDAVAQAPASIPAPVAAPVATPKPARQVQVAALAPQPKPASRSVNFGDVFEVPAAADDLIEAGLPTKGARPSPAEAAIAHGAMTGGTKLTKNMISQWALNRDRFDTIAKPVKAPRVVSRALTTDPSAVYMVGFSAGAPTIDPGRFGPTKTP